MDDDSLEENYGKKLANESFVSNYETMKSILMNNEERVGNKLFGYIDKGTNKIHVDSFGARRSVKVLGLCRMSLI